MSETKILHPEPQIKLIKAGNNLNSATDAEWIANHAMDALAAGRYRLAGELTRLAARAEAFELARATPDHDEAKTALFGPPLDERVRNVPVIRPAHLAEVPRPRDLSDATSHAPQVCRYAVSPGAQCHQPIGWTDGASSPGRAGWYHLDGTITDHQAVVG